MGMRLPPDVEARCFALAGQASPSPVPTFDTEAEFQAWVIAEAKARGWRHYHTHNSKKSVAGFPDLVLVRERVIWAELKTDRGEPSAAQLNWIDDLTAIGEEVYVWRPADQLEILRILGDRRRTLRSWLTSFAERIAIQSGLLSRKAERTFDILEPHQ